jgi:curli biogenesis system outer membrane secretion channel CsgG
MTDFIRFVRAKAQNIMMISLVLIFTMQAFSFAEKTTVGIIGFKGSPSSHDLCELITNKFTEEMIALNRFAIVEESKINALLKEKNVVQAGCFDVGCYSASGRTIGLQKLIVGNVTELNKILTISVRIIDIETGKIEKTALVDSKNDLPLITKDISLLVFKLFAATKGKQQGVFSFALKGMEPAIAVLNLDANGIDSIVTLGITDRLRIDLFNTGKFNVMEREKMEEILKEQGFQQTGCTVQSCVVEIGKLINVKYIVAGSITKINNTYSLSTRMIDLATGKIIRTASTDSKKALSNILANDIADLANGLAGEKVKNRNQTPLLLSLAATGTTLGLTGYFYYTANSYYNSYAQETHDPDLVTQYRSRTKLYDGLTWSFLALSVLTAGVSTKYYIASRKGISVINASLSLDSKYKGAGIMLTFSGDTW